MKMTFWIQLYIQPVTDDCRPRVCLESYRWTRGSWWKECLRIGSRGGDSWGWQDARWQDDKMAKWQKVGKRLARYSTFVTFAKMKQKYFLRIFRGAVCGVGVTSVIWLTWALSDIKFNKKQMFNFFNSFIFSPCLLTLTFPLFLDLPLLKIYLKGQSHSHFASGCWTVRTHIFWSLIIFLQNVILTILSNISF